MVSYTPSVEGYTIANRKLLMTEVKGRILCNTPRNYGSYVIYYGDDIIHVRVNDSNSNPGL